MKTVFCFTCNNLRDAEGSVSRDWGFGPRHFCKTCAHRVKDMPLVCEVAPSQVPTVKPEVAVKPRSKPAQKAPSMARWVRERASLPLEELCRLLVETFPDSKPGQNPKLAKGYVNCYLKEKKEVIRE